MVSNDSSTLCLLYTLFLLLLHQLHLRASGIRSGRLRTLVIRNFFTQLWRWKSPTICRLQAGDPGKRWCNDFWIWRPENRVVKDRRSMVSSRNQVKGWILPSSTFSLDWSSQWAGWWPLLFGRANFTDSEQTKSTDSNVNFNWKYPHRHNQK